MATALLGQLAAQYAMQKMSEHNSSAPATVAPAPPAPYQPPYAPPQFVSPPPVPMYAPPPQMYVPPQPYGYAPPMPQGMAGPMMAMPGGYMPQPFAPPVYMPRTYGPHARTGEVTRHKRRIDPINVVAAPDVGESPDNRDEEQAPDDSDDGAREAVEASEFTPRDDRTAPAMKALRRQRHRERGVDRIALRQLVANETGKADPDEERDRVGEDGSDTESDVDSQASLSSDGSNAFDIVLDEDSYGTREDYLQARHQRWLVLQGDVERQRRTRRGIVPRDVQRARNAHRLSRHKAAVAAGTYRLHPDAYDPVFKVSVRHRHLPELTPASDMPTASMVDLPLARPGPVAAAVNTIMTAALPDGYTTLALVTKFADAVWSKVRDRPATLRSLSAAELETAAPGVGAISTEMTEHLFYPALSGRPS